jgi:hypothetical protein
MATHTDLLTIDALVDQRFNRGQDKRSLQYRDGYRAGMERAAGFHRKTNPYSAGTSLADAWYSGAEHGAAAWTLQSDRTTDPNQSLASSAPASGRVFLGDAA